MEINPAFQIKLSTRSLKYKKQSTSKKFIFEKNDTNSKSFLIN